MSVTLILMPHVILPDLFHTYPPEWIRSVIWASGAIIAAATARSWDAKYQWIGFWALGFAPAQRLVSYVFGVGINAYHHSSMAWTRLSTMFIYVFWISVIWLISTWKDEVDVEEIAAVVLPPEEDLAA